MARSASLALLLTACFPVEAFECVDHDACVRAGMRGRCEAEQVCSYPDDACDGGHRYSPNAGALADRCVEEACESADCEACSPVGELTVCHDALTWVQARDECAARSLVLASVHDMAEQDALVVPAWIGLHDRDTEGMYAWVDGSTFDFAAWGPNEPDDADGEEDCVALGEGGWSASRCEIPQAYVCAPLDE